MRHRCDRPGMVVAVESVTAADRLRELAAAATPGPWGAWPDIGPHVLRAEASGGYTRLAVFDEWEGDHQVDAVANARLAALSPDMARLLADWRDALARLKEGDWLDVDALLARFRELEARP